MFPSVLRYGVVLLYPRELGEDAVVAVYDGVMLDRQRPDLDFAHFKQRKQGNLQVGGTE